MSKHQFSTMYSRIPLLFCFSLSCCSSEQIKPAPIIESASPEYASEGDVITINGTNFSSKTNDNHVEFNNIVASISNANANQLIVTLPKNVFSDKVRSAQINVNVNGVNSNSRKYILSTNFPEITSIEPIKATVDSIITINGRGFNSDPNRSLIIFPKGKLTHPISANSSVIKVIVPKDTESGDLCLITFVGSDESEYFSFCYPFATAP